MIELGVHLDLTSVQLRVRRELAATVTGLFGPPGAGKSALLEILAGVRPTTRGTVKVGDEVWLDTANKIAVAPEARGVGYVPQDDLLLPHLDVHRNLVVSPRARGVALDLIVNKLELGDLLQRPIRDLTPAQRKRVAIGRALASQPRLLLLDDPFSVMDDRGKIAARQLIGNTGIPALLVSEDPDDILALCDEVLLLEAGRVLAQGTPTSILAGRAADNLIPGVVRDCTRGVSSVGTGDGGPALEVYGDAASGDAVVVALEARDIIIAKGPSVAGISARNAVDATIRELHRDGDRCRVRAVSGGLGLTAVITESARAALELDKGDEVQLLFKASAARLIRRAG